LVHPQNTLYSPDDAADRAADDGTDRAGTPVTFIDAVRNTARHALSVRRERTCECRNKHACNQNLSFHQLNPLFGFGCDSLPGNNGDWTAQKRPATL